METDNTNTVTPAELERAKNNDIVAEKIRVDAEKRSEEAKKDVTQEPILVNEATKGILERQGITNVITQEELDEREKETKPDTVVNTIKDALSKPADTERQQVKDTEVNNESKENIDLSDEEFGALERAGLTEEQILESDNTLAQIKETAQNQLKKEQEQKDKAKADSDNSQDRSSMVISDEYAEQLALTYPFAKSLKGKTMEDVMKIVSQQNQYITTLENSNKVVENPKDIDKNNSQTNKSDEDLSNEEVIDFLNLTPEEASKKLNALMKTVAKKATETATTERVAEEVKKLLPNLEGLQRASDEHIEKQFYSELQKQLPDDTDAIKIVEEWKKVNGKMSNATKQSLADNTELLITTISNDYKLGKLSAENTKLINTQNSEVKTQTFNKLKELIKKSKQLGVHNAQFNFKRKEVVDIAGEPQNAGEELMDKIITRNLNRS